MNPNPHKARQARRKRPEAGTVEDLRQVLWSAIKRLQDALEPPELATSELTKLTHALSQAASSYLKAIEVGELEARLQTIEQVLTKGSYEQGNFT